MAGTNMRLLYPDKVLKISQELHTSDLFQQHPNLSTPATLHTMAENTGVYVTVNSSGETVWIIPHAMFMRAIKIQRANGVTRTGLLRFDIDGPNAVLRDVDMDTFWKLCPADATLSQPTPSSEVRKAQVKLEPATHKHHVVDLTHSSPVKQRAIDSSMTADNSTPRNTTDPRSSPSASDDTNQLFVDRGPPARAVPRPSPPPRRTIDLRSRSVRVYRP